MQVIWAGSAKRKRNEIITRIADDNPDVHLNMLEAFEKSTGRIAGTRELTVYRHYFLVYEISETSISILSVWHTAQQYPPTI